MVEVTQEDIAALKRFYDNTDADLSGEHLNQVLQAFAAHRTATLQRVIDLANACVDQGIPLTAFVPMLEDMR